MIAGKKLAKMSFYDLKSFPGFSGLGPLRISLEEGCREPRTDRIRSNHAVSFSRRIQPVRSALQWKPIHQALFLLGSVSRDGLCSTDLSRESSRYRSLSGCPTQQALSLRAQRTREAIVACRCERTSRLENLRRLRPHTHRHRSSTLRRHRPWVGFECNGLRAGCHHDRFVPVDVSLGQVPKGQGCHQASHDDRDPQLYSSVYRYYSRQSSRCECARHPYSRAGLIPDNGPSLSGFRSSVHASPGSCLFRYPIQKQSSIPTSVFVSRGQDQRVEKRPDRFVDWSAHLHSISCSTAARHLLFDRNGKAFHLSDQQFFSGAIDRCQSVPPSLADRTLFQMDQTASTYQAILRHFSQQREDSDMDRSLRLCAHRDHQKAARLKREPLYNPTDSQSLAFRENAHSEPI